MTPIILQRIARAVLWLEPLILALNVFAFWYPTPTRAYWYWLLWFIPVMMAARFIVYRRLLTRTPLDVWLVAFLVLGVINVYAAPLTRGLEMLARPLLGMALFYAMIEAARSAKSIRGPLQVMIMVSLLVSILALGSTQWVKKSALLQPVIDVMPKLTGFPGAEGGFNPNEIAGALAWFVPLMIGIALYRWQQREMRWDVTTAAVLLSVALILGQSRSAIAGVLGVMLFSLPLMVKGLRWRVLAYVGLGAVIALQVAASTTFAQMEIERVAPTRTETSAVPWEQTYDQQNIQARLQIWSSALAIVRDYPLTGVGMAMFRDGRVRAEYPAPIMRDRIIPHAHNDLLQIASDMGIPGLIVFIGMHAAVGYMLYKSWRLGDAEAKAVSVSTAAGLLAHFIYGMGDAITLWDRFFFPLWMMFGLAGAQYVLVTRCKDAPEASPVEQH